MIHLEPLIGLRKLQGLNAFVLHSEEVEVLWPLLETFYARSIRMSKGTMSLASLQQQLFSKQAVAIVMLDNDTIVAAFAGRVVEYDSYRAFRITAAAGFQMKEALARIDVLITWALKQGVTELEGWCRPAMVRLLRPAGFKPKFTIVTLDIRRKMQ